MSGSDGEHPLRKSPSTLRNAALSPLPSLSLTRDHLTDALAKSPDGGATLDLAYKGLTDVGESGAEELATVGQDDDNVTESPVIRYDRLPVYSFGLSQRFTRVRQNCSCAQPTHDPTYGVLPIVSPALSCPQEQPLLGLP